MSSTSLSTLLYFYIFFLMAPFSGRLFSHHSKMTLGLNAHNPISVAQDWNKKKWRLERSQKHSWSPLQNIWQNLKLYQLGD